MRISDEHLKHWLQHGYAVVDDFLTSQELAAAQQDIHASFPTREQYLAYPMLYRNEHRGGHMRECPYLTDVLNEMALHPEIISFVERALRTTKLMLTQSLVWAKYPYSDDFEQALHMDYMNTSLLYPNTREPWEEVTFILYYSDIDDQLGPTYVVSNQHRGNEAFVPDARPRHNYPDLYRYERPVTVRAGSMLIYSMSTIHRGSRITSRNRTRYTHHIIYRSEAAPWVGYRAWANYGRSAEMRRFIERLTPRQREMLGFPGRDHPYWTEETLRGIAARYPAINMKPYVEAAALPHELKAKLLEELRQQRSAETKPMRIADQPREVSQRIVEQWPPGAAYYRGVANYCSAVTGIPAGQWLAWLLIYSSGFAR